MCNRSLLHMTSWCHDSCHENKTEITNLLLQHTPHCDCPLKTSWMLDMPKNYLLSTAPLVNLCLKGSTWYTWLSTAQWAGKAQSRHFLLSYTHMYQRSTKITLKVPKNQNWVYLQDMSKINLHNWPICVLKGLLGLLGWAGNTQSRHFLLFYTHMYPKVPKSTLKYQKVPKLGLLGCITLAAISSTIAPYHYCHYWRRHWRQQKVRLRLCALIGYGT